MTNRCQDAGYGRFGLLFLIFILLFSASGLSEFASAEDTTAPSYSWISPADFSILTTNTIRLCVDARDNEGGSGIARVIFYSQYYDSSDRMSPRRAIGEVTSHPYEFVWDCSGIPDQNLGKLQFYCEVIDNAGNMTTSPDQIFEYGYPQIVLDRNRALKDLKLVSHYTKKKINIDGNLHEWAKQDSVVFYNNDNTIVAYSQWDSEKLYMALNLYGRSFISHYPPGSASIVGMPLEDEIELFFDPTHEHREFFSFPDRHFLIAAAGMVFERKIFIDENGYRSDLIIDPDVETKITVDGTLNDDSDDDTSLTIEFAITWKELGVKPHAGRSMGLEIWNNDKDYIDGAYFFSGWSTNASNLSNPSEWGNIELQKEESPLIESIAAIGAIIAVAAGLYGYRHYRRKTAAANQTVEENDYIRKAKRIVEEQYTEESLSRESVAPSVGLTPSYFGKLFKQETGMNFADYLTDYRIEKAKNLLNTTHKNISEIALEVGFNSQSYFTYQFKRRVEKAPTEFRADARKKHPSLKI